MKYVLPNTFSLIIICLCREKLENSTVSGQILVSALLLLHCLKMKELCPIFHEGGKDCFRLEMSPGDISLGPSMVPDERVSDWEVNTKR